MADDSSDKLLAKLDSLNDSLDDLEAKLEPLLAQTLPESLLPLETIQQAKLNVAIPYLVYDLVFIYLKTRGIDPKTHPVVAELDRVRQYFDKIKDAEDPAKRKTAVDKAAANRFIKHAIAQVRAQRPINSDGAGPAHIRFDAQGNVPASTSAAPAPPAPSAAFPPPKITSKMRARAEYERKLAELGSDAEDDEGDDEDAGGLQVFGEDGARDVVAEGKGKGRAEEAGISNGPGAKKRRRGAVDPFAGYGDEEDAKPAKSTKKKKKAAGGDDLAIIMDVEDAGANTPSPAKKEKKAAKKAKKKSKRASLS